MRSLTSLSTPNNTPHRAYATPTELDKMPALDLNSHASSMIAPGAEQRASASASTGAPRSEQNIHPFARIMQVRKCERRLEPDVRVPRFQGTRERGGAAC